MTDCTCGKQFEAADLDGVLYCTQCKFTKGLAAGRRGTEPSERNIAESSATAKEDQE